MYKLKYRMVENMILHQLLVKISRTSIYYNMQYNGYDFLAQSLTIYHIPVTIFFFIFNDSSSNPLRKCEN